MPARPDPPHDPHDWLPAPPQEEQLISPAPPQELQFIDGIHRLRSYSEHRERLKGKPQGLDYFIRRGWAFR